MYKKALLGSIAFIFALFIPVSSAFALDFNVFPNPAVDGDTFTITCSDISKFYDIWLNAPNLTGALAGFGGIELSAGPCSPNPVNLDSSLYQPLNGYVSLGGPSTYPYTLTFIQTDTNQGGNFSYLTEAVGSNTAITFPVNAPSITPTPTLAPSVPLANASVSAATIGLITGGKDSALAGLISLITKAAILLISVAVVYFVIKHFRSLGK